MSSGIRDPLCSVVITRRIEIKVCLLTSPNDLMYETCRGIFNCELDEAAALDAIVVIKKAATTFHDLILSNHRNIFRVSFCSKTLYKVLQRAVTMERPVLSARAHDAQGLTCSFGAREMESGED